MLTSGINFFNFKTTKKNKKIYSKLVSLLNEKTQVINSLGSYYKNSFSKKVSKKYKKSKNFRLIGMGGSTLGAQTIYQFLNYKTKKFHFIDNLRPKYKLSKNKNINIIISKSGDTIETIVNSNILFRK